MQEEWIRWKPIEELEKKYDIDTICDTNDERGLIITLYSCKEKKRKIEVVFDNYADSYRHTNDSFMINLPFELSSKYGDNFYTHWTFFKIMNSNYLEWLANQSCNYSKEFKFIHFCLLCPDSVVDIIARYEPIVRHLPNGIEKY